MTLFPYGECQCGCGAKTSIARCSDASKGWIKGEPLKFVYQHRPLPIEFGDGCWEWTGTKNQFGYGRLCRDGRRVVAHRWLYERLRGAVPAGLQMDHLCRNRSCVNPDHLEPVTQRENLRRGDMAKSSADDVARWIDEAAHMDGSQRSKARQIAARHGVPVSRVRNAIAGRTWAGVS